MLIVSSTGTSIVTATLYEMAQNKVNPYFTWSLFGKGTNNTIIFTGDDISTSPYYWNKYAITIATASVGLTSGIIPLTEGEYEYTVYEMNNEYDLNISNAVGIVETGILVCGLSYSVAHSTIASNAIQAIPVFNPTIN